MSPKLPPSATNLATSVLGLAGAFGMIGLMRLGEMEISPLYAALLVMAVAAFPTIVGDSFCDKRYRDGSAALGARRPLDYRALVRKCAGLYLTFASFALLYWLFPEYDQPLYVRYFDLLYLALPWLVLIAPFYFGFLITRMAERQDAYDELAWLAMGRINGRDWRAVGRHYRNWLVKAFFLPLMLSYMVGSVQGLIRMELHAQSIVGLYDFGYSIIMFTDLLYAAIGYVLTLRILNAHIQSSEPTFRGWVVAIACYAPFWEALLYARYFDYGDSINWDNWLADYPVVLAVWGGSILALLFIYSFATVCLGIRFSNLTYRGLITSGPYRFTKHPAYVAKNLSWWLVSVPFVSNESWTVALTHCLLLLGVNFIYYQRAVTEENHLSNYPEYREYALAMNQRSMFKPLVKYLPFLEYKVPTILPRI